MSAQVGTVAAEGPVAGSQEHASLASLARALDAHPVWFEAGARPSDAGLPAALQGRLIRHRHGEMVGLVVDDLTPQDLPLLRKALGLEHAFLHDARAIDSGFAEGDRARQLSNAGFRLFQRHGAASGERAGARRSAIGSAEFLLSTASRLRAYPSPANGALRSEHATPSHARPRAVVLLDLVQDYEVLRPLLALAAAPGSPFDLRVAVTDRVVKSPAWTRLQPFLDVLGIAWFTPLAPTDVAAALGSAKSLLLSASESSAAAHAFGHAVARIAPPRALRVTLQHGLECIGLRHHRNHDIDFPFGVRFASDIVLTWDHPRHLPDLHPSEADKCVPVGVVKAIAERGAAVAERRWAEPSGLRAPPAVASPQRLLVAENLHSVRFRSPARHQRFLAFIQAARQAAGFDLTIRSHPASRTLEKQGPASGLKFLDGVLGLDDLLPFQGFVSPPSTVLLDAVIAGVPTAVWSDAAAAGDAVNYEGLPVVADFRDWQALDGTAALEATKQLSWATASTAALNGVPAAWGTLVHLFD